MAQELVSQKVKYTCDGCKQATEFELVGATEETILAMQEWREVVRKVFVQNEFRKITLHACSNACLSAADNMLVIQREPESADDIDMSSLRAQNYDAN